MESDIGLSFAYGTDGVMSGSRSLGGKYSLMRCRYAANVQTRNMVVFELIPVKNLKITPGQTFLKRHFVLMDNCQAGWTIFEVV